jgi:uncharacterized protein
VTTTATTIGLISDTHGHWDPKVKGIFRNVDHILHAGDIGLPQIILELESIAPTTAVLGNNDFALHFRETEIVHLSGRKYLVHHIVDPKNRSTSIHERIAGEKADVVVFGHTHKPFCQEMGQTLFVNPGYAGKPRFALSRSVAILRCTEEKITAQFFPL